MTRRTRAAVDPRPGPLDWSPPDVRRLNWPAIAVAVVVVGLLWRWVG